MSSNRMNDSYDQLVDAINRVWKAFLEFGPVDDGRPEGDEFDEAIMAARLTAKKAVRCRKEERMALVNIVNALDEVTEPIHFKIKEAIEHARKVMRVSDEDLEP